MSKDSAAKDRRHPRSLRMSDAEVELFRRRAEASSLTGQRAGISNQVRDLAVEAVQVLLDAEGVDFEPVEVTMPVFRATDYRPIVRSRLNQPTTMEPPTWLKEVRGELARVGGNLNQLQRSINRGQVPRTPELLETLQDVRDWQNNLVNLLGGWEAVHGLLDRQDGGLR